jgi:hypothetical protein
LHLLCGVHNHEYVVHYRNPSMANRRTVARAGVIKGCASLVVAYEPGCKHRLPIRTPYMHSKDRGSGSSLTKIAAGGDAVVLVGLSTATTSREGERPCQTSHPHQVIVSNPTRANVGKATWGLARYPPIRAWPTNQPFAM